MSDAATTAGGVSSSRPTYTPHASAPREPQPRSDPGAGGQPGPSTVSDLTRREAGHVADYPQEARSTLSASSAGSKRARPNETGEVKSMPRAYETCNPKDLGILISNMLMELIRLNDQIPLRDGRLTRFHSRAPPGISVSDYLQRLIQHATLSPPILLSMVYYIDRLCAMYHAFTINSLTVHRFLITAACVAAKGLSDSFWTNPTYARIGGIPVTELATLELELLQRVQWRIVPKPEVLVNYYEGLIDRTDGWELERSESDSSSLPDESGTEDDLNGADEPA
ncbi:nuc-1 negative regulatory protein preg-like [Teratosphaeria destructans]|uniref:Nuc-1 negative regulatory protein preg-like n=1 Tax=Teratosphaeria destructans TaxID=418781 RepID=A0A9W7T063_9PEZI|nr:nuc-1 negative regulatory protein preg-like [Teratosphaeria destructans]